MGDAMMLAFVRVAAYRQSLQGRYLHIARAQLTTGTIASIGAVCCEALCGYMPRDGWDIALSIRARGTSPPCPGCDVALEVAQAQMVA